MTSSKPYLIRALYEWILDNDMTPQLVVDVADPRVMVPRDFAQDGRIVLNVAPRAVRGLELGASEISFAGRFAGRSVDVVVPVFAVRALFARENGRGMEFEVEDAEPQSPPPSPPAAPSDDARPRLRVVK